MKFDIVGSFLPPARLLAAHADLRAGKMTKAQFDEVEHDALNELVERQLQLGLPAITSGELTRQYWDKDFFFGLNGIKQKWVNSGHIYQATDTFTDIMQITDRIAVNPEHPFYSDFSTLNKLTAGRAVCRQTIPSPANLYLEILTAHESVASYKYPSHQALAEDIAEAYRQTIMQFYNLGCRSLQLDDTALGRMTDISFIETLIKGGIDPSQLLGLLTDIINKSIAGVPADMEISIYISAGEPIVPHWKMVSGANHVMPDILARLQTGTFFLPFIPGDHDSLRILEHIPAGKRVVLGLISAHTPFPDNPARVTDSVMYAASLIPAQMLSISPVSGFKLSSFMSRGLSYEDQWTKIESMAKIAATINP